VLILTRKAEQGIVIDRVTTVRILSIDGDRVKIGIDAPTSIAVLREELLDQVAGQNREAARPAGEAPQFAKHFRGLDKRPGQNGSNAGPSHEEPKDAPAR
jgi:carbon storage regulator